MKVLLVQPKIGYMDAMRSALSPPLGLIHAAAGLVGKYDVEILDARRVKNIEQELKCRLTDDLLFVGITSHTGPMIHGGIHIGRIVKAHSNVPVVWGGVHPTLAAENTLTEPSADICIIGEGEQTALELAAALAHGAPLDEIPGLAFRKNGIVFKTAQRALLDPDDWPDPPYDLVDMKNYLPDYEGRLSLFFQASRGCPFSCGFCYNDPFNRRKYRKLSTDTVLRRLRTLKRNTDFQDVYFVDDNFFVDLEWAMTIAKGLFELDLSWQVQGIDVGALLRMEDGYIDQIRKFGCRRLTVGVETASDRMRRLVGKHGTRQDVIRAISRFQNADMIVYASFLLGYPTETLDEIRQTVNLALTLTGKYDYVRCSPFYSYSPYPGTRGCIAAVEEGYTPPETLEGWADIGAFDSYSWPRKSNAKIMSRHFFESLNLAALFIDRKVVDYTRSGLVRILAGIYRRIARFRVRHLFFKLMPEKWLLLRYFKRFTRDH